MAQDSAVSMERKGLLNRLSSEKPDETDAETGTSISGHTRSFSGPSPASGNLGLRNSSRDHRYHHSLYGSVSAYVISLLKSQKSIKLVVLIVLSLQNSLFTVLRRYSQGIKKETYSKYEVLMMGEIIKLIFSAYMIRRSIIESPPPRNTDDDTAVPLVGTTNVVESHHHPRSHSSLDQKLLNRLLYLLRHSGKMFGLAIIYGIMNILSFVALRNIGAGMFTIFAQCKILTTAAFSALILRRQYSWTQWRALLSLVFGVLLFSEPIWNKTNSMVALDNENAMVAVGIIAVLIEVTLSGFASIYFEKVIKLDPLPLTIWERNFQLALGSVPVYVGFIVWDGGGAVGLWGGWSFLAWIVTILGAAGGLLVALSIKYGDSILKTLATTAAIILSSVLDHWFLNGPLTAIMIIAGVQVILSICNYTFDTTPASSTECQRPSIVQSSTSDTADGSATTTKEKGSQDIEIASSKASSEHK